MKNKRQQVTIRICIIVVTVLLTFISYFCIDFNRQSLDSPNSHLSTIYETSNFQKESSSAVIESKINQNNILSEQYINLTDGYLDDAQLSKLYKEENVFSRLQNFNQNLNKTKGYYEVSFQALQYLDHYDMSDDFVKIYNSKGGKIENQLVNVKGKERFITSLNTIQVNKNFNNDFLSSTENGDVFNDDDFILSNLDVIPVLLGNNYKNEFNIGDTIQLNYLGTDFEFLIKGFLAPNATVKINSDIFYLDNFICMPNFQSTSSTDVTEDNELFLFFMRYYLQNNRGYFHCLTSTDVTNTKEIVIELANKYNLKYLFVDASFMIQYIE